MIIAAVAAAVAGEATGLTPTDRYLLAAIVLSCATVAALRLSSPPTLPVGSDHSPHRSSGQPKPDTDELRRHPDGEQASSESQRPQEDTLVGRQEPSTEADTLSAFGQSEMGVALELACEHLLSLQNEAGWWQGELQTNVTMDAEDMLLREFLGIRRAEETERSAAWIRSQQRDDGTWSNFYGGPGDLSTTIEAYLALRLAGDPLDAEHMRAAAGFIRAEGGLAHARVFTHVWLALFGLWSWESVPALPPELILLPSWAPLNVYEFSSWTRQTVVPLSLVKSLRPVRELRFDVRELHELGESKASAGVSQETGALARIDRLLCAYERRPIRVLRRIALARAERWVVCRQEADGSWGGIQPPSAYSLIALRLRGYQFDHPVMQRGLEGLDRFMVEDYDDVRGVGAPAGPSRRLEARQSPVWDTALALIALSDAGLTAEHPALLRASEWLLNEEVTTSGDWSVARPHLAPGGWASGFANDNYPDVDDTAEVVLALRRVPGGPRLDGAVQRAAHWVQGMQSSGGGWGAFDAENTRALIRELPFLDFGEVIDEPSADVTAHALEMLAALGLTDTPAGRRGVRWLIDQQEPDGSWFGRWGVNHIYGTGAAVPALIAAGVDPSAGCIRRAVRWLVAHQNDDGGWGEDPRSYDEERWIGRGPSTASQTAWALLALHAAGDRSETLRLGVRWLVATQRADGAWDEPQYTGTGFPSDYYINYHLYRLVFPIMALGRASPDSDAARRDSLLPGIAHSVPA
jgi:squalene-hopene/tetraprenyl-beta-curcumene cyclase